MLGIRERLGFGKKTEQLKTKTNEYCHSTFVDFCKSVGPTPAEVLREIAIIACLVFKHSRYQELKERIHKSKLNQQGVVDEVINSYLNSEPTNVIRIDRRRKS